MSTSPRLRLLAGAALLPVLLTGRTAAAHTEEPVGDSAVAPAVGGAVAVEKNRAQWAMPLAASLRARRIQPSEALRS